MSRTLAMTMGGLGVWALWFVTAYGLHGAQCAGAFSWPLAAGRVLQIALWLGAAALVGWFTWRSRDPASGDAALGTVARWSNRIALAAMIFTGAGVLLISPC
jgi:hypothetical protein